MSLVFKVSARDIICDTFAFVIIALLWILDEMQVNAMFAPFTADESSGMYIQSAKSKFVLRIDAHEQGRCLSMGKLFTAQGQHFLIKFFIQIPAKSIKNIK